MVAAPMPAPQTVDLSDMVMYGFGAIPTIGSAVTANTATNAAPYTGARSTAGRVTTTGVRKIILNRSGVKKPTTKASATKATATKAAAVKTATRNHGANPSADTGATDPRIVAATPIVGESSKTSVKPGGLKKRKASIDEEPRTSTASSNNNGENAENPCVIVATSDPESERPLKRRLRPRKAMY